MRKKPHIWGLLLLSLLAFALQGCFGLGGPSTSSLGKNSNGQQVSVVQNAFKGKIYVTIGHDLKVINGDGSSQQLVGGGNIYDPALSPNGKEIAFVQRYPNYSDLAYIPTSGGTPTVLISGKGHYYPDPIAPTLIHSDYYWYLEPSWSPDGSQILFLSDLQKNYIWAGLGAPFNNAAFEDLQVFSLDFNDPSTRPQVLAYASFGDGGDRDPFYVPNTTPSQIVYAHYMYDSSGVNQIDQLFLENSTAIADNPGLYSPNEDPGVALTPTNADCIQPSLAPDGHTLAFVGRLANEQMGIYTMQLPTGVTDNPNSSASQQQALVPYKSVSQILTGTYEGRPTWSPDGKQIAYITESNDELDLWVANVSHNATTGAYALQGTPVQITFGGIDGDSRFLWTN